MHGLCGILHWDDEHLSSFWWISNLVLVCLYESEECSRDALARKLHHLVITESILIYLLIKTFSI
jgi:hypothetical protein